MGSPEPAGLTPWVLAGPGAQPGRGGGLTCSGIGRCIGGLALWLVWDCDHLVVCIPQPWPQWETQRPPGKGPQTTLTHDPKLTTSPAGVLLWEVGREKMCEIALGENECVLGQDVGTLGSQTRHTLSPSQSQQDPCPQPVTGLPPSVGSGAVSLHSSTGGLSVFVLHDLSSRHPVSTCGTIFLPRYFN